MSRRTRARDSVPAEETFEESAPELSDEPTIPTSTGTPRETDTGTFMELTATRNTFLPDGTFVGEGTKVKVGLNYAEKVLKEQNSPFKQ